MSVAKVGEVGWMEVLSNGNVGAVGRVGVEGVNRGLDTGVAVYTCLYLPALHAPQHARLGYRSSKDLRATGLVLSLLHARLQTSEEF